MIKYQDAINAIEANRTAYDNPFLKDCVAYRHRNEHALIFREIQEEIDRLFYPHFISYHEDAEFIEKLIRLTMSKRILEVGMFSGFTTLHMLRAVYPDGHVTGIDNQKVYTSILDGFPDHFDFYQGDSVDVIRSLYGQRFDLVYIDSDHSPEHTMREVDELAEVTKSGSVFVFHDCNPSTDVGRILKSYVASGFFNGLILPSAHRLDVGVDNLPHLGVFIRQ